MPPVAGHPRAKLHKDVQSALQEAAAISPHAPAAGPGSTMPDRGHPLPGQASPPQPKASKQSPSPVKPRRPAKHTQSPPPSARTLEDADRPVATSPAQAEAQALLPAQGNLPAGLAAPQPAESSELALSVCTAASTPPTGLLNSLLTNNPGLVSDRQRCLSTCACTRPCIPKACSPGLNAVAAALSGCTCSHPLAKLGTVVCAWAASAWDPQPVPSYICSSQASSELPCLAIHKLAHSLGQSWLS